MKIVRTESFSEDVGAIWRHIAEDYVPLADEMVERIDYAVGHLLTFPDCGRPLNDLQQGLRRLLVDEYAIYYQHHRGTTTLKRGIHFHQILTQY